jgi:bifunctional DNA-binding transcriptional regulator/antitoxin component of YhaV-PrlF toxin-antitoxin module
MQGGCNYMVKVVINNGQYKLTIPKDLALAKGWKKGTKLRFVEDEEGNVSLKEIPEDLGDAQ